MLCNLHPEKGGYTVYLRCLPLMSVKISQLFKENMVKANILSSGMGIVCREDMAIIHLDSLSCSRLIV